MHDLIYLGILHGILILSALYLHFAAPPGGFRSWNSGQRGRGERSSDV